MFNISAFLAIFMSCLCEIKNSDRLYGIGEGISLDHRQMIFVV